MKVVALISGGKDSCFNMMHCVKNGHEIVALANLKPKDTDTDELDSYMYQTVGHHAIEYCAEALDLPLFRRTINGTSVCRSATYKKSADDEVEDLYELLKEIKEKIEFDGVSSGAILSNYQRVRVENVCSRLGVQSLAYLWQCNQVELLEKMMECELDAILIKVAALGLIPSKHLGKKLKNMQSHLLDMKRKFDLNVCGEGGEYETMTLDCHLFKKRIVIDEQELVIHSDDAFAPVGYLTFKKMHLEEKKMKTPLRLVNMHSAEYVELRALMEKLQTSTSASNDTSVEKTPVKQSHSIDVPAIRNKPYICKTNNEMWLAELVCMHKKETTIEESTRETMGKLQDIVSSNGYNMRDICLVHIFCSDMNDFARINSVYENYFESNPPARVCVEVRSPPNIVFKLEAYINATDTREALHVQSISYWAPANIGPYSQAVKVGKNVYFSGSIGLIPFTLELDPNGVDAEALLSLHHVNVVSKVIAPKRCESRDYGCITCYITIPESIKFIERLFESQTMFSPKRYLLNIACVTNLPKNAQVEWHLTLRVCQHKVDNLQGTEVLTASTHQYNDGYLISCVTKEDIQENGDLKAAVIRNFSACASKLRTCNFLRVLYLVSMEEKKSLTDVLHSTLHGLFDRDIVLSFVPAQKLYVPNLKTSEEIVVLINGYCNDPVNADESNDIDGYF